MYASHVRFLELHVEEPLIETLQMSFDRITSASSAVS